MIDRALERARRERLDALATLREEMAIPSISSSSAHAADMLRNAEFLRRKLEHIGAQASVIAVPGCQHPLVRADLIRDQAAPTLTIYGHYDVQPPDPLEDWISPPFEPTLREGYIYGRGACDSKGNHMAAIHAVEYLLSSDALRVNVRFLIEGEEETTGRALPTYVRQHAAELGCDYVLVLDGGYHADGYPVLATGMRGELYVEIHAEGPNRDLHSGHFGGVAPNPANTLARIIGELKTRDGRVTIPGFYDGVRETDAPEITPETRSPAYSESIRKSIGVHALEGEADFLPIQRQWLRPTLDVNGMVSGFTGEGEKTIIPARAMAKISMRLVPGQDPERIFGAFKEHVQKLGTPGVRLRVERLGSCPAFVCSADHEGGRATRAAFLASFEQEPRAVRKGSTIPVVADLIGALRGQMILTGIANPDSRVHAPNERLAIDHYYRGIEMVMHLVHQLASTRKLSAIPVN